MKIKIHFQNIQETVEVRDAAEALSKLKAEAAARAPLLVRGVIKSLGDIQFAQEAVKRDNAASGQSAALPQTAEEFLKWATARGYATIIES
jgi:hypothetical protein